MADTIGNPHPSAFLNFDLRVWLLAKREGGAVVTQSTVGQHIDNANSIWRSAKIGFALLSCKEWVSEKYFKLADDAEFVELEAERWGRWNTCIDVYYVKKIISSGVAGVCSFPHWREYHAIAVDDKAGGSTLAHELGHFLNLEHTFSDNLTDTDSNGTGDPKNLMSYNRAENIRDLHATEAQVIRARRAAFSDRANMIAPIICSAIG